MLKEDVKATCTILTNTDLYACHPRLVNGYRERLDPVPPGPASMLIKIAAVSLPRSLQKNIQFLRLCGGPHERKNWTILGSDRGGHTAAVLYSLTGTCRHHDIDPVAYLTDVLRRLPSHPSGQLDEFLPDVWFPSHPCARRKTAA
jgi:hypothetical protein